MTTQLHPKVTYYRGVPLDDALLDAYPEIREPLPDTGMQERPQQEIKEFIRGWFGNRSDVFVSGNTGVYYEEGNPDAVFLPDCYVVFGEGADRLWDPYAYRIWEFGAAPDFALEIGSQSTYRNDLGPKRELYARVGIGEYWRYDPTGGEHYGEPLVGEYLENRQYRRFEMQTEADGTVWAYSPTLGLDLRVTAGRLLFHSPETGEILGNVIEEKDARLAAEARALAEGNLRLAAEAEVARLQAQLRELRGE